MKYLHFKFLNYICNNTTHYEPSWKRYEESIEFHNIPIQMCIKHEHVLFITHTVFIRKAKSMK